MALDISAYSNAEIVDRRGEENEYHDDWEFDGKVYRVFNRSGALFFRAGSYGSYNEWRAWLSITFLGVEPEVVWKTPDNFKDKPFYEIINFTDCDGMLDAQACKNLHKDFVDNRERANGDYKYELFTTAFLLASGGGIVVFH